MPPSQSVVVVVMIRILLMVVAGVPYLLPRCAGRPSAPCLPVGWHLWKKRNQPRKWCLTFDVIQAWRRVSEGLSALRVPAVHTLCSLLYTGQPAMSLGGHRTIPAPIYTQRRERRPMRGECRRSLPGSALLYHTLSRSAAPSLD